MRDLKSPSSSDLEYLRGLFRVAHVESDLSLAGLGGEDIDRLDIDASSRKSFRDFRKLARTVEQFDVDDIAELELEASVLQRPLGCRDIIRDYPKEGALVAHFAGDCLDVDRSSGEGFRDPGQLSRFVLNKNLEFFRVNPLCLDSVRHS